MVINVLRTKDPLLGECNNISICSLPVVYDALSFLSRGSVGTRRVGLLSLDEIGLSRKFDLQEAFVACGYSAHSQLENEGRFEF